MLLAIVLLFKIQNIATIGVKIVKTINVKLDKKSFINSNILEPAV